MKDLCISALAALMSLCCSSEDSEAYDPRLMSEELLRRFRLRSRIKRLVILSHFEHLEKRILQRALYHFLISGNFQSPFSKYRVLD